MLWKSGVWRYFILALGCLLVGIIFNILNGAPFFNQPASIALFSFLIALYLIFHIIAVCVAILLARVLKGRSLSVCYLAIAAALLFLSVFASSPGDGIRLNLFVIFSGSLLLNAIDYYARTRRRS